MYECGWVQKVLLFVGLPHIQYKTPLELYLKWNHEIKKKKKLKGENDNPANAARIVSENHLILTFKLSFLFFFFFFGMERVILSLSISSPLHHNKQTKKDFFLFLTIEFLSHFTSLLVSVMKA